LFTPKVQTPQTDLFADALLTLKSREDAYRFLEDVLTVQELLLAAQRFEVAKMLHDGVKYLEIMSQTGASSATISRVNRSLHYGSEGYHRVIKKMNGKREEG